MEWKAQAMSRPEETDIAAVRRLEEVCRAHDGTGCALPMGGAPGLDPSMPWLFLARAEGELAGVLTVAAPVGGPAEVTALVAPAYRRQGCFHALLAAAAGELRQRGVGEVCLKCDRESDDGFEAAAALGGRLEDSVFTMECRAGEQRRAEIGGLRLAPCEGADLAEADRLAGRIFGPETAARRCAWPDGGSGVHRYLIRLAGAPVGVAAMAGGEETAVLRGLGLIPEFRGQGLGTRTLSLLLGEVFAGGGVGMVQLQIDGGDTAARRMSLAGGFREAAVADCYRLELPKER